MMKGVEDIKKKRVLVVSYLSPSANLSGAVRIRKLIKFLPEFGWEPVLLTVDKADGQKERDANNPGKEGLRYYTLINRAYNKIVPLFRSIYYRSGFSILIEECWGWYRPALKRGLDIVREEKVDAIFSSLKPVISALVASHLQKQTGIPWIAELRDPWSLDPYSRKIWPICLLEERLEKRVLGNSNKLVTVSQYWVDALEKLHSKKVVLIPNGFDEEDYEKNVSPTKKFTITYTGNIYRGKRDPEPFFQAIARMAQEGVISPKNTEVRFFGSNVIETISPIVGLYGLEDFVKIYGPVSFEESIRRQQESSVLLQVSWNSPKDAGTTTAKIYEYIGAGRPILALAFKSGAIERLLFESGCGIVANDVWEIKNILMKWSSEFNKSGTITSHYHPDNNVIGGYTRREQARKLAGIL